MLLSIYNLVSKVFPLKVGGAGEGPGIGWSRVHLTPLNPWCNKLARFAFQKSQNQDGGETAFAKSKTRSKCRLSDASPQSRRIEFRRWTFLGVDCSMNNRKSLNLLFSPVVLPNRVPQGDSRKYFITCRFRFKKIQSINQNEKFTSGIHTLVFSWILKINRWPADARAFSRSSHLKGKSPGNEVVAIYNSSYIRVKGSSASYTTMYGDTSWTRTFYFFWLIRTSTT